MAEIYGRMHVWNDGEVKKPADTYVENGIKIYTCKECGATKTEELTNPISINKECYIVCTKRKWMCYNKFHLDNITEFGSNNYAL